MSDPSNTGDPGETDPDGVGTVLTFPNIHPNPPTSPPAKPAGTGPGQGGADPLAEFGDTYATIFDDNSGCKIVLVGDSQHRSLLVFRDNAVIAQISDDDVATAVAEELFSLPDEGRQYSGAAMILTIGLIGGNGLWLAGDDRDGET